TSTHLLIRILVPYTTLFRSNLVCMDQVTFEQKYIPVELFGDSLRFMKEEMVVQVGFESENAIMASAPKVVELEVTYTENAVKGRSEEHTSELQSRENLVCRL